ncbi:MAG: hypothetical protein ABIS03_09810, partial [Gemmatimonadaceae bacterium]
REMFVPGYDEAPKKSRTGLYAGIVTVLAVVAFAGFVKSQRAGGTEEAVVAPPVGLVGDSTAMQAGSTPVPESSGVAIVLTVDSQAVRDSIRRARRDSTRRDSTRKAVALADSVQRAAQVAAQAEQEAVGKARRAAAAMLRNAGAVNAFMEGATHKGGVLGSKRKGDLQTQINALEPFLSQVGLSYSQFKGLVRDAGVDMFDEFGRIVPDSLGRFATGR